MSKQWIGIDVSHHQGVINWHEVKEQGIVKFVMVRLGYGTTIDRQFTRNVQEMKQLGIPFGVYLYSYALNVAGAQREADFVLRTLKAHGLGSDKLKLPVAFDMEDADGYKKSKGMPSNATLVGMCKAFMEIVEDAGYYTNLYASRSWLENQLKSDSLDKYDKWLAEWNDKPKYKGTFNMWQYTDSGRVNGIRGGVDMNIAYWHFNVLEKGVTTPKPVTKPKPKPKPKPAFKYYKIKSGETLGQIASKEKTTVEYLMSINPTIRNRNLIFAGQTIKLPNK